MPCEVFNFSNNIQDGTVRQKDSQMFVVNKSKREIVQWCPLLVIAWYCRISGRFDLKYPEYILLGGWSDTFGLYFMVWYNNAFLMVLKGVKFWKKFLGDSFNHHLDENRVVLLEYWTMFLNKSTILKAR